MISRSLQMPASCSLCVNCENERSGVSWKRASSAARIWARHVFAPMVAAGAAAVGAAGTQGAAAGAWGAGRRAATVEEAMVGVAGEGAAGEGSAGEGAAREGAAAVLEDDALVTRFLLAAGVLVAGAAVVEEAEVLGLGRGVTGDTITSTRGRRWMGWGVLSCMPSISVDSPLRLCLVRGLLRPAELVVACGAACKGPGVDVAESLDLSATHELPATALDVL